MRIKLTHAMLVAVCALLLLGCNTSSLGPSDMVHLGATANPNETRDFYAGNPDATSAGVFTVPADGVLVIINVIIHPLSPGPGILDITMIQSDATLGDRTRQTWHVPNSQPTQFDFSPGEVISSGSKLMMKNESSSAGRVHVSFFGYVAPVD